MRTLLVTRLEPDHRTTNFQCTVEPAILAWPSGRMSPSSRGEKCLSSFSTCQRQPNPVFQMMTHLRNTDTRTERVWRRRRNRDDDDR